MSPSTYAVYASAVALFFALTFTLVGAIVLWRAHAHWFTWLTAHVMLFLAAFPLYEPMQVARLVPPFWIEIRAISWPLFVLFFFLFPNGRAVPRWARWPLAIYAVMHFAGQLLAPLAVALPGIAPAVPLWEEGLRVLQGVIFVVFPFILGCQIYRYARVSTSQERLQTKWFVYGFALFFGLSAINDQVGSSTGFGTEFGLIAMAFLPLSLAFAILRYRLWDIDVIIRRTLVYAVVTALLALVFYGSVVILQSLFTGISGQQSPVAIVASTLAIAALFSPLRRRVQDFVDRRFFRRKYDAQRVLAGFAEVARDETDLATLTNALLSTMQETVQPKTVSVWIAHE